jgi:hypothetical protein
LFLSLFLSLILTLTRRLPRRHRRSAYQHRGYHDRQPSTPTSSQHQHASGRSFPALPHHTQGRHAENRRPGSVPRRYKINRNAPGEKSRRTTEDKDKDPGPAANP